jgi:hypothetical protein
MITESIIVGKEEAKMTGRVPNLGRGDWEP